LSIAGTGANNGLGNGLPAVPRGDSNDESRFPGIAKLASRAGTALSTMLGGASGASGLLDALTGVDPDIMAKIDSAGQRYELTTRLLDQVKGGGANAAPDAPEISASDLQLLKSEQASAKQEMLDLAAADAEARVVRVKGALNSQFALGARLPSIEQLGVDPATYKPQSKQAAEAFTQRLTIDMVSGVAELDALQAEWQKLHGENPGSPQLDALERAYKEKYAKVEKLISAYENQTGEKVEGTVLAGNQTQDISGLREAGDELEETGVSSAAGKISSSLMDSFVTRFFKIQSDSAKRMAENDRRFEEEMKAMEKRGAERRQQQHEVEAKSRERASERAAQARR
jgi:hypothetical protein